MKKLLVVLFLLANLSTVVNASETLFVCETVDHVKHSLVRDPATDTWTLVTEDSAGKREEQFHSSRIGISSKLHSLKDTFTVELYFNRTDATFTVGVNQRLIDIDGYVKELANGKETNYRECEPRTFLVDYSQRGLFSNFTTVD